MRDVSSPANACLAWRHGWLVRDMATKFALLGVDDSAYLVGYHLQTLTIHKLGCNQNYYTFTLISLIKIVMLGKFPGTEFINYKCLQMRLRSILALMERHRARLVPHQGSGCGVQGSGCGVQGSGFRVQGPGCFSSRIRHLSASCGGCSNLFGIPLSNKFV